VSAPDASPPDDDASAGDDADGVAPADAAPDAGPFVQAPHAPFPQLPGNARRVLSPATIVSIFASNETFPNELTSFGDALVASAWWKTATKDYGLTTATHVAVRSTEAITTSPVTQASMDAYIGRVIARGEAPAPTTQTMYLLYLPPGIADAGNPQCTKHGGYHTTGAGGRFWGVAIRCPLANTGLSELEYLTVIASHEIAEMATDPQPGQGYTLNLLTSITQSPWASTEGEVGDMCVGTRTFEGSWTYQRSWSNSAAAAGGDPCVPAVSAPYYNVSAPQDWYRMTAGGAIDIPVTGWSTARLKDWVIDAQQFTGSATFGAKLTSPTSTKVGATTFPTINNGAVATLHVTAPAATSAAAVIWVMSLSLAPSSTQDQFHFWPVGVYTQ
jgi:hypothetical protein